ncbi:flavin reductase domain protein FMN-binding protein [Syntrophobotulus glycolicus DSM 8271]|uniref:Flavin reductase domain protein FMN-binding protein n=1 Tax=Syntrophobotulus glycolicus (strain DSM 8271 / FlGlyR) TaxID=645991 RepID=F0T0F9_SYNGF|nr:flavin reductase family protein [Syntrophobotulus glycolicus]ADY57331.1 flavin reductase domain protein FMN-binding protein [Syntrophobotulus glycolicus DSM 8271]
MKKSIGSNTFAYPTPAWIIGSYDQNGKANGMTAAWAGVCCSDPPAVTVSLRKSRHSYQSILEREAFTVSIPSASYLEAVDFFGIASGKEVDKFEAAGLTPVRSELVDAPYVGEFPLILECKLLQTVELGQHIQFIGRVVDVKAEEDVLGENGKPEMRKISPLLYSPGESTYYGVGEILGKAYTSGLKFKK